MIANPFTRKPKGPIERALDAFDQVRSEAAKQAASVRDAADGVAETLTEIGPPARPRRLPLVIAGVGAALGLVWFARSRRNGSTPAPAHSPAAATAARTTAEPAAAPPLAPTRAEAPKEETATTSESESAAAEKS